MAEYEGAARRYRRAAVKTLAAIPASNAFEALVRIALDEKSAEVRETALVALRERGYSRASKRFVKKGIDAESSEKRRAAVDALRDLGDPECILELIEILEVQKKKMEVAQVDAHTRVDLSSRTFAGYDDSLKTEQIIKHRDGTTTRIVQHHRMPIIRTMQLKTTVTIPAAVILRDLTGQPHGEDPGKWREWWHKKGKNFTFPKE